MEKLHQVAFVSVGRAVGFAGLAIFTLAAGLSFDPVMALRSAGLLLTLVLAVLLLKARWQHPAHYRDTETWLLLDKADRPDERFAGFVITNALRDAYYWFARWTAGLAAAAWAGAIVLDGLGVTASSY